MTNHDPDDDDRLRQLESDLRALRPPPPSTGVARRLAHDLSPRPRPALRDRALAATMSLAALAACTIVGLLLTAPAALTPPPARAAAPSPDTPTLANPEPLLARADLPSGN